MATNRAKSAPEASAAPIWHSLSSERALTAINSSLAGLTTEEARQRLSVHGRNELARAKGDGPLTIFVNQINNPLIYVLIGSAVLSMVTGKVIDGAVILAVVIANAIIGFVQEYRAGKAIEALITMVPETATALRDGQRTIVPATELVPGDIVYLQSGDKVPADMRLLQSRSLQIDEAPLTGESLPVTKLTDALPDEITVGDRKNMTFGGTLVTYGAGTAVVVATGVQTEIGRISSLLNQTTQMETPLTRQIGVVGRYLTIAILIVAAALFVIGLARGYPPVDAIIAAITLAVGAIPEGLPAVITIALAIGVQRMATRRAVIRRLPAVETLGSTTVICSDKTGTLTRNEMTVQALWTPISGRFTVSGVGYQPIGQLTQDERRLADTPGDVRSLLLAGILCNDSELREDRGAWSITGDPTEGALVVAAAKLGMVAADIRALWPRLDAIPFESERQYMATLHQQPDGGQIIVLKGAPEVILGRTTVDSLGRPVDAAAVLAEVEALASQGMRVLALAEKTTARAHAELTEHDASGGFTLIGLQGMIDPPRPEAIAAVRTCHEAGITVKMITGDHRATAAAIGHQLGLLGPDQKAITGVELSRMADPEVEAAARQTNVFARVAPEHKLRLVRALQAQRQVVAMTGDGVNDAPALKQADIGIAMGITGTAVSKESADIVLTDDNFASIAAAVEEGRRVYDNLIKSLAFILPTNIGLALILLVAVAFFPFAAPGEPLLPMLPTQILWINLVGAVALALPLAFEAMEPNVMRRPPRDPDAPIMSGFVVFRTVFVAVLMAAASIGLFLWQFSYDVSAGRDATLALREAQTMAVTTVILFQVFYVINCRSLVDSILRIGLFSNPTIYVGIGAILLLQAAFIYLPPMNTLFSSLPLSWYSLALSAGIALLIVPIISIEKTIVRRMRRG